MTDEGSGIRFGIMIRSSQIKAWQREALTLLLAVDGVEPALVVIDDRPRLETAVAPRLRRITHSPTRLWNLYNNGWVARRSAALQPVDLPSEFSEVPRLRVQVEARGHSEYFTDDDVAKVRGHDLDFVIRFGFGILRGDVLTAARHGIWSFHHGDDAVSRGGPPGFWEIVRGDAVTGAMLQQLTERLDAGVVLARGWFPTAHHSYVRNTDRVHFGSTQWPAQLARRLSDDGQPAHGVESRSTAPITTRPADAVVARFLAAQVIRFLRHQWRSLVLADNWHIGVVEAPVAAWLDDQFEPDIQWIGSATTRTAYAADPFIIDRDSGPAVLYERYDRRRSTGEIWEVDLRGAVPPHSARLPVDEHASYPFVFEDSGRTYCLPQVSRAGVPLFESVDGVWTHVHDLITGVQVLDPTLARHNDRWWLFGTLPGRESTTQLHVWHAAELTGQWEPHGHNPVKTDTRSARPAGGLFEIDGRLIRPAQNCSTGYGRGISLCEVLRLDANAFDEVVVAEITPDSAWPHSAAMHTLNGATGISVIDAASVRFDRHRLRAEFRARIRRISGRQPVRPASPDAQDAPIRVLAVIDALGEGGSERSLAELLPLLRDHGVDTTVALLKSRGAEGAESEVRALGFRVDVLPSGVLRRTVALRRLLRQLEPDVIHSSLFNADLTARLARLGRSTPILTSLVNTTYSAEYLAASAVPRWKLRGVQAIDALSTRLGHQHFHAVSEPVSTTAQRALRIPSRRITVVHRGRTVPRVDRRVARAAVRAEFGLGATTTIVISAGRQEPAKDIPTLIAACAAALRTRPEAVLVLAGREGTATAAVKAELNRLAPEVRRRVLTIGHRSDVATLLAASDIYVSTSRHEGLPGAIIEAMAASLPVIASDIAGTNDLIVARTTAISCRAGDVSAFGSAIGELLDDEAQRHRLGAAGRDRFLAHFTAERAATSMESLYRSIAAGTP